MENNNSNNSTYKPHLGFYLYRSSLAMRQFIQKEFHAQGYDITTEQWAIMNKLRQENDLSQNELAERLFKQKPNISRIIEDLEKNKLITRINSNTDRRKYKVSLTENGLKLTLKLCDIVKEVRLKACESITKEEIDTTINSLNKLYENICKYNGPL